jgi:hypothetical protein
VPRAVAHEVGGGVGADALGERGHLGELAVEADTDHPLPSFGRRRQREHGRALHGDHGRAWARPRGVVGAGEEHRRFPRQQHLWRSGRTMHRYSSTRRA